jgi:hypothetical protein
LICDKIRGEGVVLCRKENEKEEEMRKEREGLV